MSESLEELKAIRDGAPNSKPEKEECEHSDISTHWDHNQCKSCGHVLTDGGFGCASRKWFPNIETAKFYQVNGFLPSEV